MEPNMAIRFILKNEKCKTIIIIIAIIIVIIISCYT